MLRQNALAVAVLTVASLAIPAVLRAQPTSDRFFRILDRNENGQIDPDEWDRVPPLRDYAQSKGIALDRPLSADDFAGISEGWNEQVQSSGGPVRSSESDDRDRDE